MKLIEIGWLMARMTPNIAITILRNCLTMLEDGYPLDEQLALFMALLDVRTGGCMALMSVI